MLGNWAAILVYLLFAAAIPAGMMFASFAVSSRAQREGRQKAQVFESGVADGRFSASNFSVNYYLTAMLFIIFDIEIVFLYPLAVNLELLGPFALAELCVFIAVLALGYVYVWRKGALEWR